jgi:hypothetical protein
VDILVRREPVNAARMMRVSEAFGFGKTGIAAEDFLRENYVIQLGIEPNRIDLLISPGANSNVPLASK